MKLPMRKGNIKKKIFNDFCKNMLDFWKFINYDELKNEKKELNESKIELNNLLKIKENLDIQLNSNINGNLMKQNQQIIKEYEKSIIDNFKLRYNKEELIKINNNKIQIIDKHKDELIKTNKNNIKELKIILEKYEEIKNKLHHELNIYANNINYYKSVYDCKINPINNKIKIKEETIKELREIINKKTCNILQCF